MGRGRVRWRDIVVAADFVSMRDKEVLHAVHGYAGVCCGVQSVCADVVRVLNVFQMRRVCEQLHQRGHHCEKK